MVSEVKGFFAAANELKRPFNRLRQLALALGDTPDELDRETIATEMVAVSNATLRQFVDLERLARLEDEGFRLEPVSVRGICDAVRREAEGLFWAEQRQINFRYRNKRRLAMANPELLRSIIYNICLDAAHYSTSEAVSTLSVSDSHGKIRIRVRDYGPAVPAQLERELKAAGRLERPTLITMRPGSSSLGLYLAAEFTHYMHAEFGVTRHRDGASFFVDLPVSRQMTLWN